MRLFVAIPVAETTRAALLALVRRLRPSAGNLRWTDPEGWHITLAFLGQASPETLPALTDRLCAIRLRAFSISFTQPETFDRAGAFVVGVRPSDELTALHPAVTDAVAASGFQPEQRPFRPHLTLARARRGEKLRLRLDSTQPPSFTAGEFRLYQSFLEATGVRYEVRACFSLIS